MKLNLEYVLIVCFSCIITLEAQDITNKVFTNQNQNEGSKENIYIQTDKEVYKKTEIIWFKAYILNTHTLKPSNRNTTLFVTLKHVPSDELVFQEKFKIINGFVNGDIFLEEKLKSGDYILSIYTSSSIAYNSMPVTSYKTIILKDDTARIFMDSNFDQEAYSVNSKLNVELSFYDSKGKDFFNEKIVVRHYKGDKLLERNTFQTDEHGVFRLKLDNLYVDPHIKTIIQLTDEIAHPLEIPFEKEEDIQLDFFPEGGKLIYGVMNRLAFKATDLLGNPKSIQAELLEDETPLFRFKSLHEGMGFFNFEPEYGKHYKVRLKQPRNKIFDLPEIHKSGFTLFLSRNTDKYLVVKVSKSEDVPNHNITMVIQSKGIRYWESSIEMKKDIISLKILKDNLPNDVVELTLYSKEKVPIAERLVFLNTQETLKIKNLSSIEPVYQNKHKIVLKLKTENVKNKPVKANLGLRVYDNALRNMAYATDIKSHYYLFSNVKGEIVNPHYYFDTKNKYRFEHFDLLLLTQGWRNYVFSDDHLKRIINYGNAKISDDYLLKIYGINDDDKLLTLHDTLPIRLVYPKAIYEALLPPDGQIAVPLAENQFTYVKPPEEGRYLIVEDNSFKKIDILTSKKKFKSFVKVLDKKMISKKDLKGYYYQNSQSLDEVVVKTSKNRNRNSKNHTERWVNPGEGDYVCREANILNCVNHSGGYEPINGGEYYTNAGTKTFYKAKKILDINQNKNNGFHYVKGYRIKKEFFSPDYEIEPKSTFDIRTTLAWEPNIFTDENGLATISFYTSEINSSFTIHVEGVDAEGNIGSKFYNFSVKPSFD